MVAVLQLSVVRSFLFFITLVLWTDEQYDYGDVSVPHPYKLVIHHGGTGTFQGDVGGYAMIPLMMLSFGSGGSSRQQGRGQSLLPRKRATVRDRGL